MNDNKINMMQELTYLLSYRGKLKFFEIYICKKTNKNKKQ